MICCIITIKSVLSVQAVAHEFKEFVVLYSKNKGMNTVLKVCSSFIYIYIMNSSELNILGLTGLAARKKKLKNCYYDKEHTQNQCQW